MVRHILPLIPHHNTYAEPFAGGAAVFFAKETSNCEVLNDLNNNLVNFYQVLSDPFLAEQLISKLNATPYSHSLYLEAREVNYKGKKAGTVKRAWATFVNHNWAFAKSPHSGWGIDFSGGQPLNYQQKLKRLKQQRDRLTTTYIECIDAVDLIKKWDSPDTFFYCDPPYPATDQGDYTNQYTVNDFYNLVDTLKNIKGSFILSCYPMDGMPEEWQRVEINTKATAMGGKHIKEGSDTSRTECLWLGGNYQSAQQKLF